MKLNKKQMQKLEEIKQNRQDKLEKANKLLSNIEIKLSTLSKIAEIEKTIAESSGSYTLEQLTFIHEKLEEIIVSSIRKHKDLLNLVSFNQ